MEKTKIGRILAIATSVCAVLLGILFIISCAHLYFTGGDTPYSWERVGEYLTPLIIPSVITLLLVVGGVIYNVISGEIDAKNTSRTNSELLESFSKRYDLSSFNEETKSAIIKERKKRKLAEIECFSASAVLFTLTLIYVAFVAEFTVEDLNDDILAALAVALPLSSIGIAIHIPRIYLAESSAARELDLIKAYIKENGAPKVERSEENAPKKADYAVIARYIIIGASVALVILGIFNGGMADVLAKAVKICTECIGLG